MQFSYIILPNFLRHGAICCRQGTGASSSHPLTPPLLAKLLKFLSGDFIPRNSSQNFIPTFQKISNLCFIQHRTPVLSYKYRCYASSIINVMYTTATLKLPCLESDSRKTMAFKLILVIFQFEIGHSLTKT